MNDTDIATLRSGYDLLNGQISQIDSQLDNHRRMVATLEAMSSSLQSSASVIAAKLEAEGVDLSPPAEQLEIPFEVVE